MRFSKGGQPSGLQPYFSPQAVGYLCRAASTTEERITVAVCCLCYSLFLRVSEAASISPCDLRVPGMASFPSTKVRGTTVFRRPLARWVEPWARHLLSLLDSVADMDQPFAERGAVGLEEVFKRLLRGSRWHDVRWPALRRGGAAASNHRKAHACFFMWWGIWQPLQIALEYATCYSDTEVVGRLVLPDLADGHLVDNFGDLLASDVSPAAMFADESIKVVQLVAESVPKYFLGFLCSNSEAWQQCARIPKGLVRGKSCLDQCGQAVARLSNIARRARNTCASCKRIAHFTGMHIVDFFPGKTV